MHRLRTAALLFLCIFSAASAAPAQLKTQAPGYFRLMIGSTEVTALYDGAVYLSGKIFHDLPPAQIAALFATHFQDAQRVPTAVNAYLVNTGEHLVLIDAGSETCFGPDAGRLPRALRAAGYAPQDIDTVLITHMHGDHVCGLLTAKGERLFPNATVWAAKAEADWWLNDAKAKEFMFKMAQTALAPYRAAGRFKTFAHDGEIVPGIRSIATPGHSPGHTAYLLSSQGDTLLFFGDIVHAAAVQFAHPEVSYQFDSDSVQAVASRQAIFADIVKHGWMIAGAHLPFPGIGRLRREGDGYAFVPVEYREIK